MASQSDIQFTISCPEEIADQVAEILKRSIIRHPSGDKRIQDLVISTPLYDAGGKPLGRAIIVQFQPPPRGRTRRKPAGFL